jgi:hypothetical protein
MAIGNDPERVFPVAFCAYSRSCLGNQQADGYAEGDRQDA